MRKFYTLTENIYYPGRWYPGMILDVDNWAFTLPRSISADLAPFELVMSKDGEQTDYSQAGVCAVHIGNDKVVEVLSKFEGVEFFPLIIKNPRYTGQYYAIKVSAYLDCLDEKRSIFQMYTKDDPIRPDKAGDYHSIVDLYVDDKTIPENTHIFRLLKHKTTLIVSCKIKEQMESMGLTGLQFKAV